ncbi:MAG: 1-deoxy-D-xylulose-5-phosphate reductoisomerase [Bacteroidia bacterium]|nr:1-deoxy-D-xylulose-5-phosphate reductoisomerase [Bacteroidia bacterium]
MRRVVVLGASGSIGQQALSLLAAYPDRFRLVGLSIHRQIDKILPWLSRLNPEWVAITDPESLHRASCSGLGFPLINKAELHERLETQPIDIVLNAIVGATGFWASWHTLRNPAPRLALANKETLVFGGQWLVNHRHRIIPVDSEHSALFQCLSGEQTSHVEKLILTASGGPFRGKKTNDLEQVAPEQALAHPVWRMGTRITIDSATLMNKALELIEAHWLFDIPPEQIEVWVHPQCIVHSLVLFRDGTLKAQLSLPDMRLPILYALSYPERLPFSEGRWQPFVSISNLTFEPVDEVTFPALRFAKEALRIGGAAPALLNAADEVAVDAFLRGQIPFLDIFRCLEWSLQQPEAYTHPDSPQTLEVIEQAFRLKVRKQFLETSHAGRK